MNWKSILNRPLTCPGNGGHFKTIMKSMILVGVLFVNSTLFAQQDVDLFLWAGQSNALGRQGNGAEYPADVNNLDSQIPFHWTVPNGSNSNGWTTMETQDLGHYFPDGHFGPEVTFSRKLVQAGYSPAIFKFTQGATSIYEHWLNPGDGGLYDNMVAALNTAIADLENQGHTVTIKGLIWIQGESDSNSQAAANAYANNLMTLINDLRTNVVGNPILPIILGVDEQFFNIADHERHQILNAHQDIALNEENIKFTSMYGYPKADVTHLTPMGLISHGEDIFDSYELLVSGHYPTSNCILSSPGNHDSFARTSWGQSFTTDCSGTLSSITFEAITQHNTSATFTLYNGADCSGTVLVQQSLNTIEIGNNVIDVSSEGLRLDQEHTYYFDIVSDNGTTWRIDFSDVDNVSGVLRCTSDDGTASCGRTFLDFDMDFSVVVEGSTCSDITNIYSFEYNNHTYEVIKEAKNWMDAAACAVGRGGVLARIDDAAEQAAVWDELINNAGIILSNTVASNGGGASYVWLGGTDLLAESVWIWDGNNDGSGDQFWSGDTNGNSVGGLYSNWGTEPDDAGDQDGLAIALTQWPVGSGALGSAGQWNDLIVDDPLYYLIEYPGILSGAGVVPAKLGLGQNYPNPFNPQTSISFFLPNTGKAELRIFDLAGHMVQTLVNEVQDAGFHEVSWMGHDDSGQGVASGTYFYRLTVGGETYSRKMLLLK